VEEMVLAAREGGAAHANMVASAAQKWRF